MAAIRHETTAAAGEQYLGVGAASAALGFLGLAFTMFGPFGALLSAAGLVCGIVGLVLTWGERHRGFWWSLGGTALSVLAFVANLGILDYRDIARLFTTSSFWTFG